MKHRSDPNLLILQQLTEIANQNAEQNYQRKFSVDSLRVFLGNCLIYKVFYRTPGVPVGVVSVRQDGELGFIVDPAHACSAYREMVRFADSIEVALWAKVQTTNVSVCKLLKRLHFRTVSKTPAETVMRRDT